jgi:hypothetical protein
MRRLKTTEVASHRNELLTMQSMRCDLCKLPLSQDRAVLDHDHSTGVVRGTLHNGCNALLGKVENNHRRYGVVSLPAFLAGCTSYLQKHEGVTEGSVFHPTHKTDDEKRIARNTKARKARAAKVSA